MGKLIPIKEKIPDLIINKPKAIASCILASDDVLLQSRMLIIDHKNCIYMAPPIVKVVRSGLDICLYAQTITIKEDITVRYLQLVLPFKWQLPIKPYLICPLKGDEIAFNYRITYG